MLHRIVGEHLETFLARRDEADEPMPSFVADELCGYLRCGVLAHGASRFRCGDCGRDRLVARCAARDETRGARKTPFAEGLMFRYPGVMDGAVPEPDTFTWGSQAPFPHRRWTAARRLRGFVQPRLGKALDAAWLTVTRPRWRFAKPLSLL